MSAVASIACHREREPGDAELTTTRTQALTASCPPVATGAIGWWKFDEGTGDTTADSSGQGNPGVLGGGVSGRKPSWVSGRFGGGLLFDGVDDLVAFGNAAVFDQRGSVTVEAWINPDPDAAGGARIISKGGPGRYQFDFAYKNPYGPNPEKLYGMLGLDPTGHRGEYTDQWLSPSRWTHVALVYDRQHLTMYIDGRAATPSFEYSDPLYASPSTGLFVGARYNAAYPFKGIIDEVRVYNRALAPSEVAGNACPEQPGDDGGSGGAPGTGGSSGSGGGGSGASGGVGGSTGGGGGTATCAVVPGYVGRWQFDEGEGEKTQDVSGFANTGVLGSNMPSRKPRWAPGKFGSALSFDGVDDVVACGYDRSLDLTGALTVEAWINPAADSPPGGHIVSKGRYSSYPFALIYQKLPTTHPEAPGWNFTFDPTGSRFDFSRQWIVPGQWSHVALVYDQINVQLFINGSPVAPAVPHTEPLVSSRYGSLFIGSRDNAWQPFKGLIDEVRVYGRALTPSEVASNAQCAGGPSSTGQACLADSNCLGGQQCGQANGAYFGFATGTNACWDARCSGASFRAANCGIPNSLCGRCSLPEDTASALSFEDATRWTVLDGIASQSDDHAFGQHSLQVASNGDTRITSPPLSSLGNMTNNLFLFVKLPERQVNSTWFGDVRLSYDLPSHGKSNVFLGAQPLTGRELGRWVALKFVIADADAAALRGNYSDLRFTIALSVPPGSDPYAFDELTPETPESASFQQCFDVCDHLASYGCSATPSRRDCLLGCRFGLLHPGCRAAWQDLMSCEAGSLTSGECDLLTGEPSFPACQQLLSTYRGCVGANPL